MEHTHDAPVVDGANGQPQRVSDGSVTVPARAAGVALDRPVEQMSPQEAKAELKSIQQDPTFRKAYVSRTDREASRQAASYMKALVARSLGDDADKPPGIGGSGLTETSDGTIDRRGNQAFGLPGEVQTGEEQTIAEVDIESMSEEERGEYEHTQAVLSLRASWGGHTEENVQMAIDAGERLSPGLVDRLNDAGLGNNVDVIKDLHELAAEEQMFPGLTAELRRLIRDNVDPDEAQLLIAEAVEDKEFTANLTKSGTMASRKAKAKWRALGIAAHPPSWAVDMEGDNV